MNNILQTIKKMVGIAKLDDAFDTDLILLTNSVIALLSQLGLQEADKTPVIDETTTWDEFLNGRSDCEMVKTFIGLKVRLIFDPPASSAALQSLNSILAEQEWRICNLNTNKGVINDEQ